MIGVTCAQKRNRNYLHWGDLGRSTSTAMRRGAPTSSVPGSPSPRPSSMKVHSCGYLDDKDCRDEPVDSGAERRPPPGVGHVLATFLPEVLEPVAGVAGNEQPHRGCHAGRGEHHED